MGSRNGQRKMAEEETNVKGAAEINKLAEKGLALFAAEAGTEAEGDLEAATAFKAEIDAKIKALNDEAEALTGKENKKARTEKSKEASALNKTKEYIDAELVTKGKPPKHGHFVKTAATAPKVAAAAEEVAVTDDKKTADKKEKPKKAMEAAGISKAERDELEKIKTDIITLKKELKEQGMSGGQMNKDERKEKKGGKLSAEAMAEVGKLQEEIEEYRQKLVTEFKYSKKEIAADPDMADMVAKLAKLQGKK